jgi:uncharacterized secreted protein with C-terminal beta-propeller domain
MFLALAISGVFIKQIIDEILWNKRLRIKKQTMRVTGFQGSRKRQSFLFTGAVVPTVFAIVLLVAGVRANPVDRNVVAFTSGDDIINVYNAFNDEFGVQSYGYRLFGENIFTTMAGQPEADLDYSASEGTASEDYSETNTQVVGVDEMDNVLTDGKYMYIAEGNQVKIVLVYTQEQGVETMTMEKIIPLQDPNEACGQYHTQGMYVDDNYLIVIGNEYSTYYEEGCYPENDDEDIIVYNYNWGYGSDSMSAKVYSIADDFELMTEYTFSGNFLGTRKIDDELFIVTNSYIPLYDEEINVDDYLPEYEVNNQLTTVPYEEIKYVEGVNPNSFTTFYGIDLSEEAVNTEVILGDGGYNLYVSEDNMYLAGRIWNYIAFADEIVNPEVSETQTAIIKVKIDGADLTFDTYGTVGGYTLNQFSMDEQNGVLRIATTTGSWGTDINNRVFILNDELEVIGKVEGLGKPGETIKSVRFVGDYGYVVTFEQTDPFYVIDLSDNTNPEVLGELEITGFSSYLQPLGDDFMLGIGFGDSKGGTRGIKISVYDITDKTNPVVFDEVIYDYSEFGYAYSSVTYNHKDLLVNLSKGLISLPFSSYNYNNDDYEYNSGILVFGFDEEVGLSVKGYVQHEINSEEDVYVYKSKFISDYFYTISNKYIKVSTINDPVNILNSIDLDSIE